MSGSVGELTALLTVLSLISPDLRQVSLQIYSVSIFFGAQ
jgi:hypothetical protein